MPTLRKASFRASLGFAKLQGASLIRANLDSTALYNANLQSADLRVASLQGANLTRADLSLANLSSSNVDGAKLSRVVLTDTVYAPSSPPPNGYLEGLVDLNTVVFGPGNQSGLVQLREQLRLSGLRGLEREATFAIEHNKVRHARCKLVRTDLRQISYNLDEQLAKQHDECLMETAKIRQLGGWMKLVFFEWTTGWGLYPGRALAIMLVLLVVLTFVYAIAIVGIPVISSARSGIYRVWPADRIDFTNDVHRLMDTPRVERLIKRGPSLLVWAFYFSMLSAFQIGWRDLNVGSWLSRIQPAEYTLRAAGWVRVVSGLQSLISVYLVAIWVLTYFGRPFE